MRRTSRCATIRFTALATLNGSTPMSTMRVTVDGASLVCSVDSTRWPVSAALIAMEPVSRSRISPTMMMFGSCQERLQRGGEGHPDLVADEHLVDAHEVVLDRV